MPSGKYAGRSLELYFNSPEQKQKFEAMAEKAGCPFSKYILSVLETHEHPVKKADPKELESLREEIINLKVSNRALAQSLALKDIEIKNMKNLAHLADHVDADYDPRLLDLIRNGPIHTHRLLEAMFVSDEDGAGIRVVTNQLEDLEAMGLIRKGSRGWSWRVE